MLDALVAESRRIGVDTLRGHYIPTKKNAMVQDHYTQLGFDIVAINPDGSAVYSLEIAHYIPRNRHIKVSEVRSS